jgi:peptidoglycan/LPS O-acetylase OafA/YrhL
MKSDVYPFKMNNTKRLLEIDVLRGIAALGVVIYHYTTWYNEIYHHSKEVIFYFPKGKYGVELFFLISGFVIFMTLTKIKTSADFIIGRFSRLYPAYWTAIILTFTILSFNKLPEYKVTWYEALINLSMLQFFLNVPSVDLVYWTLSVELSFYVIMYFLFKTKILRHIEAVAIGWLLLMILSFVLEHNFKLTVDPRISTLFLLKNANVFIIGIMYYKLYTNQNFVRIYGIIAACLLIYKLEHSWGETFVLSLFILVFELVLREKMRFINNKILVFLGTISYSLYLIHQNIGYVIIRNFYYFGISPNIGILFAIFIAIVLATAITFLIEQPMIHFIKKQYKSTFLASRTK